MIAQQGNAQIPSNSQAPSQASDSQPLKSHDLIKDQKQMQNLASAKLDEMTQKQWILRWRGKDVFRLRQAVKSIVDTIQQCSGLIGQAVTYAPSPATPAWAGICVLMTLITADDKELSKAINGLEKISIVVARAEVDEKSYIQSRGSNEMFEKTMVTLYCGLITFYAKASRYFAHHTITRFARNVIQRDDWSSIIDDISARDEEADKFATQLSLSNLTQEIKALKASVDEEQRKKHVKELLAWASPVKAGEQHRDAKFRLGDRYLSPGQWLMNHDSFRSWEQDLVPHLLLQGAVGTGKTSLMAICIEQFRPHCHNLAYCYCSPTLGISDPEVDVSKRAHEFIFRYLVAQLALSLDGLHVADELELAYESSRRKGAQGSTLYQNESLDLLLQIIESRDSATIIIDAHLLDSETFMELEKIIPSEEPRERDPPSDALLKRHSI